MKTSIQPLVVVSRRVAEIPVKSPVPSGIQGREAKERFDGFVSAHLFNYTSYLTQPRTLKFAKPQWKGALLPTNPLNSHTDTRGVCFPPPEEGIGRGLRPEPFKESLLQEPLSSPRLNPTLPSGLSLHSLWFPYVEHICLLAQISQCSGGTLRRRTMSFLSMRCPAQSLVKQKITYWDQPLQVSHQRTEKRHQ